MSAIDIRPDLKCPQCGSEDLNPKHGIDAEVWYSVCPDCGFEGDCIWGDQRDDFGIPIASEGFWVVRVQASNADNDMYYGPFASQAEARLAMNDDPTIAAAVEDDCEECYLVFVNDLRDLNDLNDPDPEHIQGAACVKCGQPVYLETTARPGAPVRSAWVDSTEGDACPEGGVHGVHKRMVEYDQIAEGYKYEHNPEECDPTQATTWVLHMNVRPELVDAVLERMSELPDTNGFYGYGDSFQAWGETSDGDHDKHLAIYFKAEPARAHQIGMHLWAHASIASIAPAHASIAADRKRNQAEPGTIDANFAVSTAGDFAEQVQS